MTHKYGRDYQGHSMSQLKELRKEKKDINIRLKAKPLLCQEHDMELNFYCGTCEQLVCHYCTTTDHNGQSHEHNTVKKMANKHKTELDDIIKPVEEMIGELSKVYQKVTTTRKEVEMQATKVDKQIDDYYDQLQQLQQQREELKKELHEVSTQKMKSLLLQLEKMERTQEQLEGMKELTDAIKDGSDQEVLFMKKQVTEDVKRMSKIYKRSKTEPVEPTTMQVIPVEEYQDSFPQFANIIYGDADPLTSMAENFPSVACVNNTVNFTIVTKNVQGNRCSKGGSKVILQVQSSSTRDVIPVAVKVNQDGSYSASLVPKQAGEVKLSVIINGLHIQGSPYSVSVCRNYFALNVPSKIVDDDGRMGQPWGIAFGKDGMWAVADHSNHCVYIFDSQDQVVTNFGAQGNGNGQFKMPTGVAFGDDSNLYVVDKNNNRVQKFNIRGEYVLKFGKCGSSNGQLQCPLGITVHNKRVYVADQNNHRISVFQCDGNFSQTIGQSGELNHPYDVAVNNNQLLVANYYGNCISVFTLDGNYISKFGTCGTGKGVLRNPASLTIGMYGSIIINGHGNNRVSVFNKDGVFIHCFGSYGSAEGQFSGACGIALSPAGNIYICDHNNKRVQSFLIID